MWVRWDELNRIVRDRVDDRFREHENSRRETERVNMERKYGDQAREAAREQLSDALLREIRLTGT